MSIWYKELIEMSLQGLHIGSNEDSLHELKKSIHIKLKLRLVNININYL